MSLNSENNCVFNHYDGYYGCPSHHIYIYRWYLNIRPLYKYIVSMDTMDVHTIYIHIVLISIHSLGTLCL